MKSAREIAMEKAEKLGKLSPEELKKRRDETCVPVGQALAKKYLAGWPMRDVRIELDKFKGDDLKTVVDAWLKALTAGMSLDSAAGITRVLEAWRLFRPSPQLEKVAGELHGLVEGFEKARGEAEARALPRAGDEVRRELEKQGISGSAITVNLAKARSKLKAVEEIKKEYGVKLEKLEEELLM